MIAAINLALEAGAVARSKKSPSHQYKSKISDSLGSPIPDGTISYAFAFMNNQLKKAYRFISNDGSKMSEFFRVYREIKRYTLNEDGDDTLIIKKIRKLMKQL